ncbi:TlpA disulfide reductase family protein [Desulfuromonas sp. AOP6]|uniref:TlpA disulfide reductase family protein n=1 Tax=Desulfuromonas sp. AOP6 TaxID=1566351 RepID=UPI001BD1A186|nr:TlpA disulfide reductase family protein [Desulfuromonas sp. AOP6]
MFQGISFAAETSVPAGRVVVGSVAPDFTLKNLDGESVSLSQFRGKVVFLNFWASWCPPCREEMPSMERLNEVFGSSDFVMLAVNVEDDGQRSVPEWLKKNPYTFPILLDPQGQEKMRYGVTAIPETFLINKKGVVVDRFLGAYDWSSVYTLKEIFSLINEE